MTIPTTHGSLCAANLSSNTRSSTGSMKLSDHSVSIRFTKPEDSTNARNSAGLHDHTKRKSIEYLSSHDEASLSVNLDGPVQSPVMEVVLQKALIKKLPLLLNVESSTSGSKPAEIKLPCTIWALVSLLILLEGEVTVQEWFEFKGEHSQEDEALPGDNLAVCSSGS